MKLEDIAHTHVGGIKTACITRAELVKLITTRVDDFRHDSIGIAPLLIFDSNGHGISLANSNKAFMDALSAADVIHADGQSVVSMSKWVTGPNIPERSATTDTIHDIPKLASESLRHFLLGGNQQVVEKCANILADQYANFTIAGTQHGYFDKNECDDIIDIINSAAPDVLWVGLGKPLEQEWVVRNKHKLKVPVIISCGGCYNYVTGDYARAPQWMQNAGIEWLHRALTEPKKFLWRYITTNPHSIYCVLKHKYSSSEPDSV